MGNLANDHQWAASEHKDREEIEETGRGDRKVGADEAGTAMPGPCEASMTLDQLQCPSG